MNLTRMKTRAILTDVCAATRLKLAHVKGINVLSADGSAKYVDQSYFGTDPANPGSTTPFLQVLAVNSVNTSNTTMDTFWKRADDAP
jgi:hypothetical protein